MTGPLNIDGDVANADWTKHQTWDIPASTPAELYVFLARRGVTVAQFKELPVFLSNQERLPWLATIEQPATRIGL